MRYTLILGLAVLLAACSSYDQPATVGTKTVSEQKMDTPGDEQARLEKTDPVGNYGSPAELSELTAISTILADPAAFEGKKVRVSGAIKESCAMRGCWIDIADATTGAVMRFKVADGEIVFPRSSPGYQTVAEGVVERMELSQEQAINYLAHLAEEKGEVFDSTSVSGPMTIWRLKGSNATIGRS